jgi:hypothetical protein
MQRSFTWMIPAAAAGLAALLLVPDGGRGIRAADPVPATPYLLTVSPDVLIAGQHVGGFAGPPVTFEFTLPETLRGGGLPGTLNTGWEGNRSIVQIELPLASTLSSDTDNASTGAGEFDNPLLCWKDFPPCSFAGQDGYWKAVLVGPKGSGREVQLAVAGHDPIALLPYPHILGVYLQSWQLMTAGERLRLAYTGRIPARATAWAGRPLRAHLRYRSFVSAPDGTLGPGPWTVLSDDQVAPLAIEPQPDVAFVRTIAPLDVAVGTPFQYSVVVTDRYGNPRPITGSVELSGGVNDTLAFQDEWRREGTATYAAAGNYRIVPAFAGARPIYHYSRAWDGPPPAQRLVGDLHVHSGDGGEDRKFLGWITPGDHMALYTTAHDTLTYLKTVAGEDFAALTEHSVRTDDYQLPPAVAADPEFAAGGRCTGDLFPIHGLGDWWSRSQRAARAFDADSAGSFIVFPGYEWHSHHITPFVAAYLHRIVMFRDFDPADALPILPGDVRYLPPHCLERFYNLVGYGPNRVLVVPHMMSAYEKNIDWDYAYGYSPVATRALVESYQRVGEIFSARNYNQQSIGLETYHGEGAWTAFEGEEPAPGAWTFRYGWRNRAAHIGVIGSSDNHQQQAGTNDDIAPDGSRYHLNEPAGYAVVLASSRDRAGIFDALGARRTYATTGVRAWLDFKVGGRAMGTAFNFRGPGPIAAEVDVMAGMTITRVEVWGAQAGNPFVPWQKLLSVAPSAETWTGSVALQNPLPVGGFWPQEWLYYVRVFLETPGAEDGQADDLVWSSPVWVTWSR